MTAVSEPILVSIGMPVYNESAYIDAALTTIRAQDYENVEIIISDNASTDGTVAICKRHADDDPRIRIEVAEQNLGVTKNFRRTVELAKGEYFMWAAGHDTWSSNLVSECVKLLKENPTACLAYSSAVWIGQNGEQLKKQSGWTDTRGLTPIARFFTIFWGNMHPVLGLMRISQLRSCAPMPAFIGGDLALLADLALRGDFVHAARSSWSRRDVHSEANYEQKVRRYVSNDFGITDSRLDRVFPLFALPLALVRLILRSRLGILDKLTTLMVLLPSLALRYRVGRRASDR